MSCSTGLHNTIKKILNKKPWYRYIIQGNNGIIHLLNNSKANINYYTSYDAAVVIAAHINDSINNGEKIIGDIAFPKRDYTKRGIVVIEPLNAQLDLLNTEDSAEISRLQSKIQTESEIKEQEEKSINKGEDANILNNNIEAIREWLKQGMEEDTFWQKVEELGVSKAQINTFKGVSNDLQTKEHSLNLSPKTEKKDSQTPTRNLQPALDFSSYTNHSGGAYGGDTFWDLIGREFGVTNHLHYKDSGNSNLSQQLRNKGIKATVLTKEQMDFARQKVKELLGIEYKNDLKGNLQVRNFYQVYNADAVYAVAKLNSDNKSVSGGTNTAIQLGIKLNKPIYVWDINSEQWYEFNGEIFEKTKTPILAKNFAGIGTRDIENYNVQKDGKWQPREEYVGKEKEDKAKQAIRDVYANTFKATTQPTTQPVSEIKPEVKELFDSNPELANRVYEVLGFKQIPKIGEFNLTKEELIDSYIDKDLNILPLPISEFNKLSESLQEGLQSYLDFNSPDEGLFESTGSFIILYDGGFNLYKNLPYKYQSLDKVELRKYQISSDLSLEDLRTFIGLTYEPYENKVNQKITSQQKQQAQQLYSQYLEQNPNGSVEQFKSWVDEFNRDNQKLNSNIQIFSDNNNGNFDSSSLKDDDLALMLFNQALGLNLTSANQLTWNNIKDNIFFEKEDGSLGVKNLAFVGGNLLSTKKATLSDFINQKGLFPEYKVFIGESVIYPNVFEVLEENEIIKQAVFENLFNLSGAFEQVKKELNNHSPETFVIETPHGKFTFPKRFASGFFKIASTVDLLLKENQSSYIQDYLASKKEKEEVTRDGKKVKPEITKTLTVNDTIVQNAIGLIGNPIIENAIKNNTSVKIQVFSNAEYSEDGVAGWYLPASNTIYLHESMLKPQHLSEGLPLIAHELIHSVTEQSLQFDKNFQREIQSLLDRVKSQSEIKDFYGFKSTSEFLSEAFSSQEFRQLLKDTQFSDTENLSVWQKFVNAILKLFGKNTKYSEKTITTNAEQILNSIISQNSYKITYVNSTIADKINSNQNLLDFISQKSQERLNQIQEIFNQNPELSKIGTVEQYSQYLDSLNKPNTNPILQNNQQEQVKKFAELQERLNNKEFLEGAKNAYENSEELKSFGTQEEYNDYIARVSLGIIKNPTSGDYNYTSQVKDIAYRGGEKNDVKLFQYWTNNKAEAYMYAKAHITKGGNISERNPIHSIFKVLKESFDNKYNNKIIESILIDEGNYIDFDKNGEPYTKLPTWYDNKAIEKISDKDKTLIKNFQRLQELYGYVKIESESDLMKQYDDVNYIENIDEYKKLRNWFDEVLDKNKIREDIGKITSAILNIKNPYTEEIVQEDLQNDRDAYKNGHDGAFLMDGGHFLVKTNNNQIHELGSKQDIEGFKDFVQGKQSFDKELAQKIQTLKGKLDGSKLSEIEGKLEANKDRLIELLGSSMYSEKLKDVVYKELLQNAFDATKIAESKGLISKGEIDIEINEKERIISFTDNGIGMTPEIVQKAFFTIGGTYKGEDVDNKLKSGGLGLAKMAFIFGSEKLNLETIHNGIKTTVDATSQEIRADNFKIRTEPTNQKNGTKVSVKIPKTYVDSKGENREIDFPRYLDSELSYSFLANPLIGNVDINYSIVNRESSYREEEKLKTNLGDIPEGYVLFSPAKTSFADMNIYIDTKNITRGNFFDTRHKILSSGLYQFDVNFEKDNREKIPLNIIIDIKPKVDATNTQYPFNNQRENFKPTVKNDIGALNKYLALLWASIEIELLKSSFNKIKNINAVDVENVDSSVITKNKEIVKSFTAISNSDIIKTAIEDFNKKNKEAVISNGGLKTEQLSLTKEDIDRKAEKEYSRTFKAEKEISINKETGLNLDSNKPIIHNNTDMTLDEKSTKFLSEISSIMVEYKKSIIDFYGENYSSNIKNQLWGVSIDKTYGGVNVNPSFLNMLAINPFYHFPDNPKVDAVNYIAVAIDHLIIHELNHNFEREEGAQFTGKFLQTYSEIHSLPNHFELVSKLKLSIKNNLETIKKLNYEYKQSENVESGFEGNKIEDNNQRRADIGIKSISKNDSSDNDRATRDDTRSSEKFGEIVNSNILSNKSNSEEQENNIIQYRIPTREEIEECLKKPKAENGAKFSKFTKGSEWEVVSDLGAPSFTKGGEWRLEGAATHNTLDSDSPKIKAEKGIVISKFKPTKAKENSTSIYNAIPTAIDFDINSNNVDNIIADARRRKDVSLYDGNSYKTDYGQDENGEYISFYRKDGNTLTDLFGTSKEYYDRRYIEPRDILKLKTEGVTINDNRRINNLTGAPLKNNKKGVYGYPIIEQIIKAANKYEIDPYVAISMALQETNLGKTGAGVENPFHMNGGIKETPENLKRYAEYFRNMKKDKGDIIDRAMNMMKNVSYKDMPKNPGNYSDEVWRIQSHNGWGYITPNTEIEYDGGGDRYEMKIPKEGVSMKKNPIYGRFIKQLKDESIATNKDIQRLVEYFSKNSSKIIKK